MVSVVIFCNASVVAVDIPLGVGAEPTHPAGTGIFQIRIQPKGGFSAARRTDHHAVNIRIIHKGNRFTAFVPATDNDALRKRIAFYLLPPQLRRKKNLFVCPAYFRFGRKPSRAVLTVPYRSTFDVVEIVNLCK